MASELDSGAIRFADSPITSSRISVVGCVVSAQGPEHNSGLLFASSPIAASTVVLSSSSLTTSSGNYAYAVRLAYSPVTNHSVVMVHNSSLTTTSSNYYAYAVYLYSSPVTNHSCDGVQQQLHHRQRQCLRCIHALLPRHLPQLRGGYATDETVVNGEKVANDDIP
jgi:hypothetical protein